MMKKNKKNKLLRNATFFLVASIVLAVLAFSTGIMDGDKWNAAAQKMLVNQGYHAEPIFKTAEMEAHDIDKLVISASSEDVTIQYHQEDKILVEYYEEYENQPIFNKKHNTLSIYRKGKFIFLSPPFVYENNTNDIIINLPKTLKGAVEGQLSVSSGKLVASGLEFTKTTLSVSSGTMNLDNCTFNNTTATVSSGKMNLDNCEFSSFKGYASSGDLIGQDLTILSNADLSVSSGEMKLTRVTIGGDAKVYASSGEIEIHSFSVLGKADLKVSSGEIELDKGEIHGKITAYASSGEIELDAVEKASDYDLKVSSGRIEVVGMPYNAGDLGFQISVSSGSVRLNNSSLSKGFVGNQNPTCFIKASVSSGEIIIKTK